MKGKIYGVGVGPGDPELLTLKAVRILKECDILGIPAGDKEQCTAYQIALQAVPEIADKEILAVDVPMGYDADRRRQAYDDGVKALVGKLSSGHSIAFINLGDPSIYATYMELHARLVALGYEPEIISGVPSFCAVAARLGVSLGTGNEEIHILPGRSRPDGIENYSGTRVIMKSGKEIVKMKGLLKDLEGEGKLLVRGVSNCGMPDERVFLSADEIYDDAGYFSVLVVKELLK